MKPPASIRAADMRLIEDLFEMHSGYVLDFSNKTFAEFFIDELGTDIDRPRWAAEGSSKAKRLRYFLRSCSADLRARTLQALWDYREAQRRRTGQEETIPDAKSEFAFMLARISGIAPKADSKPAAPPSGSTPPSLSAARSKKLKEELLAVSSQRPQARGYAFERYLKELFDVFGLAGRASFRLVGEQIDGSFELFGETYLLEAKWQAARVGAADLRSFNGKVEDKAAWSRGLFISNSGFSDDGLAAFGRGKRVVCMDGLDLYELLERGISFADVIAKKARRAAETGEPFTRVRDLYV
jgi:hypothetical protein